MQAFFEFLPGYCLLTTTESLSAVDLARSGHLDALLVCDDMPDMSIGDLVKFLNEATDAPIAIVTAKRGFDQISASEIKAAKKVIEMPFVFETIREALEELSS